MKSSYPLGSCPNLELKTIIRTTFDVISSYIENSDTTLDVISWYIEKHCNTQCRFANSCGLCQKLENTNKSIINNKINNKSENN